MCQLNVSKYTVEPKMPNESAGREALHTVETGARGDVHNYCTALRRGSAGDPGSLGPGAGKVVAVTRSPAAVWVSGDHGAIGWEHGAF